MIEIEIELPWPPSINHYWRRVGVRTLISREGRRFRAGVLAVLANLPITPFTGPLEVEVDLHPPDVTSTTSRRRCSTPSSTAGCTPTTGRSTGSSSPAAIVSRAARPWSASGN